MLPINLPNHQPYSSSHPGVRGVEGSPKIKNWARQISWRLRFAVLMMLLLVMQQSAAQQTAAQQTMSSQQAAAQPGFFNPFRVVLDSNLQFDSNVFRLSPSIDPVSRIGRSTLSDRIIVSSATLKFDKSYSLQRIEGNVSVVDNRYNNFSFLDFTALNYGGAWHWNLSPRLHGNITGSHNEALNNFANMTGFDNSTNKNLRISDVVRLDGVYEIDGAWRIIGGLIHNSFKNNRDFVQDTGQKIQSAEGGIRYDLPSGSSLTYKFRGGWGEFIGRPQPIPDSLFDTKFTEKEHQVHLVWPVSGKTSIDARAGHLQRNHEHYAQRDFSGFVGNFNFNWAMTGKTKLTASWERTLRNFQTAADAANSGLSSGYQPFATSYIATDRFSIGPAWQIDDKVTLRTRYDYSMMDFLGGATTIATSLDQRNDRMHSGMIALDWLPHKLLSISAMLNHDRRTSNLTGFDFHRSAASVTARITF